MTPRGPSGPSSRTTRRPRPELAAAALVAAAACATAPLPPPEVVARAASATAWSGSLRVSVRGPDVRGRSRVLMAFRRPDAIRIEIPGPTGARLVAVARGGRLVAVLPAERAFLETGASPADLGALLGVGLSPEELMDVLVGVAPSRLRGYRARWGETLPRRVEAVLEDGTKLVATVDDAEAGLPLPEAAFDPPPHDGHRRVDADEARRLLGGSR